MLTISRKENTKFLWPLLDNFFFFSSLTLPSECYLEKEMQPTPIFLPGKSHGWRNLVGYSPWGHKELDMTD